MQQRASLRSTAVVAARKPVPLVARRVLTRAYVTEKDKPPTQGAGGSEKKIRVGING